MDYTNLQTHLHDKANEPLDEDVLGEVVGGLNPRPPTFKSKRQEEQAQQELDSRL